MSSSLLWRGRSLSVAVRRLRADVALGEFAALLKLTPPQIDTVAFRCGGQAYVAFGAGLPAMARGEAVEWRGQAGEVLAFANAADTITELTQNALDAPSGTIGRGLAKVVRLLHVDKVLDRLGAPEWLLVMSDWGPYEAVTEPLPDAEADGSVSSPLA